MRSNRKSLTSTPRQTDDVIVGPSFNHAALIPSSHRSQQDSHPITSRYSSGVLMNHNANPKMQSSPPLFSFPKSLALQHSPILAHDPGNKNHLTHHSTLHSPALTLDLCKPYLSPAQKRLRQVPSHFFLPPSPSFNNLT